MKTSRTAKYNRLRSMLGFTLMEVLIGFAVGGLILTMVASGFQFGDRRPKSRNHQDAALPQPFSSQTPRRAVPNNSGLCVV